VNDNAFNINAVGNIWHWHMERAEFDEFLWRDHAGRAHFHHQCSTKGRHRDRVWPALSHYKRVRHKRCWEPHWAVRNSRSIDAASLLTILRRWYPCHPLDARHTLICDLAQRPPRYDDFRRYENGKRRPSA
jgi:hypothetical protein